MNEQDFNRIKEISKELNDIKLRNNLTELQLRAEQTSWIYYDEHAEKDMVMLLTRQGNTNQYYKECKITKMTWDKDTKEFEDMNYNDYLNYK